MMKWFLPALAMIVLIIGCGGGSTEAPSPAEEAVVQAPVVEENVVARHDLVYTCDCGPECECKTVAVKSGKCECGSDLVEGRMLMINGTVASLCGCGPECKCTIESDDPTKCGCGNEVKLVDLAGTGLYFCNCGGSCKCNHVSDVPGECGCGMQLKTI